MVKLIVSKIFTYRVKKVLFMDSFEKGDNVLSLRIKFVDTEGNHLEYDSYLDGGYVLLDDGTKIVPSRTIWNK